MAATVQEIAERSGDRRSFETHWRMNPATRAVFDEVLEAALAAHGDEPFGVVLDVGCGRQSNVVFPGAELVVGLDVDDDGLTRNETVDVAVHADAVGVQLPEGVADAIACIYVLEHVEQPDVVFAKLARALRPGGVMVVAVPIVSAPKAVVTKHTPLRFHTWVYRRLLGRNVADHGDPFATVLDGTIRPDRLEHLAEVCGLEVLARRDFEDNKQRQLREKAHLTGSLWAGIRSAVRAGTFGRVDPELSDVAFAFQRRQPLVDPEVEQALASRS